MPTMFSEHLGSLGGKIKDGWKLLHGRMEVMLLDYLADWYCVCQEKSCTYKQDVMRSLSVVV